MPLPTCNEISSPFSVKRIRVSPSYAAAEGECRGIPCRFARPSASHPDYTRFQPRRQDCRVRHQEKADENGKIYTRLKITADSPASSPSRFADRFSAPARHLRPVELFGCERSAKREIYFHDSFPDRRYFLQMFGFRLKWTRPERGRDSRCPVPFPDRSARNAKYRNDAEKHEGQFVSLFDHPTPTENLGSGACNEL